MALESISATTDFFSAVLVVSISTLSLSEVETPSMVTMVSFSGRAFSYFGFRTLRIIGALVEMEMGLSDGTHLEICASGGIVSDRTSK